MSQLYTYDAAIIGGGPAGTQCALWLHNLGFKPILFEKTDQLGGLQGRNPYINTWIASNFEHTGVQIAGAMEKNLAVRNIDAKRLSTVGDIQDNGSHFTLNYSQNGNAQSCTARYVCVATGVADEDGGYQQRPDVLIGTGHIIEATDFKNKHVAILGGGDSAAEHYELIRNKHAASVTMFARTIRARNALMAPIPEANIFRGHYEVEIEGKRVNGRAFDIICVMYGWRATNPLPIGMVTLDSKGFLQADAHCRTSHPRIFAIGECSARVHPCAVTAMADGVIAAKAIEKEIEGRA